MNVRTLAQLLFLAGALVATGCKTPGDLLPDVAKPRNARVIDALPAIYTPPSVVLGAAVDLAERRNQEFGLVPLPELHAYLNELLQRIKEQTGIPQLPGTVHVTALELPEYNTTPDANIYISLGVLKNLETEDELVALLAHELAHIVFGDHDAEQLSNVQKQLQFSAGIAMGIHNALSAGDAGDSALSGKQADALKKAQVLIEITDAVILPAWSRSQEERADFFATDIAERLGYSYNAGLKRFHEKLGAIEREAEERRREERSAQAQSTPANSKFDLAGILIQSAMALKEQMAHRHDDVPKRLSALAEYRERFYPEAPPRRARPSRWAELRNGPAFTELVANYMKAREARRLLDEGRIDEGLDLARQAASGVTRDHPLPMYVLARAHRARNDQQKLNQTLAAAKASPEAVWYFYEMAADMQFSRGRKDQGIAILEDGYRRFAQAPSLRVKMIRHYHEVGDTGAVSRLQLECNMKTPYLRRNCAEAAQGTGGRA